MTIKVSMAAVVAGGETLSDTFSLDVAHTSLSGTIAGGGHLVFSLQPDSGDKVRLLFLTADNYGNLTYQIQNSGSAPTAPLELNLSEPQLLIGDAVNAVQPTPSHLAFWNAGTENIKVNIMVGRDAVVSATPLPPSPVPGRPSSVSGRSGVSALEKSLRESKTKLADAHKAKAANKKLLVLNQDIEAIQKELAKARKG